MWRKPVGDGAMRTRTDIGRIVGAGMDGPRIKHMLFGAHVSAAGGISKAIDRVEEIGGNAVQVFTQSPRMWRPTAHTPEEVDRFRARRRQARVKAVSCHALYLVNLASADRVVRENSLMALRATMETADAIGSEAVVFHVGSHLGLGFDEAVALVEPALRELLELTTDDLWLCMENAAGAGGTIGRSISELAALSRGGRPPSAPWPLPRLVPLVGVGRRRVRSRCARDRAR